MVSHRASRRSAHPNIYTESIVPGECEGCGAVFTRSDGRGRHFKLQPECEAAHYAKTQGKAKRKGSLAAVSGDELSTSKIGGTQ